MMNTKTSITLSLIAILLLLLIPTSPCPANCLQCSQVSQCIKCASQFVAMKGQCVTTSQKYPSIKQQIPDNAIKKVSRRSLRSDDNPTPNPNPNTGISQQQVGHYGRTGYQGQQKCVIPLNNICILCNTGYSIGDSGQCIPSYTKCLQFSNNYLCAKCDDKFLLQNGQCVDYGCGNGTYYQCNQCKNGYNINIYKFCQAINCNQYKQGKCVSCQNGYILSNQLCYTTITNCKTQQQDICSQCASSYYLNKNKCIQIPQYCIKYSSQTQTCTQCKDPTLVLISGICVDAHCSSVQVQTQTKICTSCEPGYQITQDRKCTPTFKDNNCIKMQGNRCTFCNNGYYVNNEGKCSVMPNNCVQPTCRYCNAGYYSKDNKCLPLTNCTKYAGNMCLICDSGFSLTLYGTCINTVQNCMQYSLSGCSKCPSNYILSQSPPLCTLNSSYIDPNCQSSNLNRRCILCKPTFRLQPKYNNLCISVSGRCKTSGQNGQCLSCYQGYKLNQYIGDCVIVQPVQNCAVQNQGICTKCANRYYLTNNNGGQQCKEVDALCNNYQKDLGYCLSCYDGYVLHNNMCQPISAQLLSIIGQPNAASTSSSTSSSLPTALTTVATSSPISILQQQYSNCLTISPKDPTKCTSCYSSSYLDKNTSTCIKVSTQCKTHSNQTGACLSCYQGYLLQGGKCTIQIQVQNSTSESGVNTSGSIEGCKKIDQTGKICLQCIDRYVKDRQLCKPVSNLCNTYDNKTGACLSCYQGYTLTSSNCVADATTQAQTSIGSSDISCSKYSENKECIACVDDYFLTKSHQCIKAALGLDQNCTQYDNSGYCTQCKNGHQLTNFLCV